MNYVLPVSIRTRYGGERARLALLRDSFQRYHASAKVFVFCPPGELKVIKQILYPEQFVVEDESILLQGNRHEEGWRTQQIVKLAAHQIFGDDEYFVTIDSDNVLIRDVEKKHLFSLSGRPFLCLEDSIYGRGFMVETLDFLRMSEEDFPIPSKTPMATPPLVFHAGAARKTLDFVSEIKKAPWITALCKEAWTELSLYYIVGRKQGWWNHLHKETTGSSVAVYYQMVPLKKDLEDKKLTGAYICMHSAGGVSAVYLRRLLREFDLI